MNLGTVSLREQIMSVSLDEGRGTIHGPCLMQLLNAAGLGELLIRRRLLLSDHLEVRDMSPTGEPALDGALATVVADGTPRPLSHWVRTLHSGPHVPRDAVLARLVQQGLLSLDEAVELGLVRWSPLSLQSVELLREMEAVLRAALYSSRLPDERTCLLIALLDGGKLTARLLGRAEACATHARASAVVEASPVAREIRRALADATGILGVRAVQALTYAAVAV